MQLIKFQLRLIASKLTIIIFLIASILLTLIYISVILSLDGSDPDYYNRYLYFYNSSIYFRIIINFISIYLFSHCFSKRCEEASYILIMLKYSRLKIVASKIISCIIIIFAISCFSFVSFTGIGLFCDGFFLDAQYINGYISLVIVAIIFGLIASILIVVVNNMFTVLSTIILSIFIGELEGSSEIEKILFFAFPSVNEYGLPFYGYIHYLFLLCLYFFILVFIYYNKDIN
ncbi:MAG: hypothetical protein IJS58_07935 [Bacilli bacterium]|nr:hypothetical protein [Bacilli bacterium]